MNLEADDISLFLKKHWPSITLGIGALIFFGYGLIYLFGSNSSSGIVFEENNVSSSSAVLSEENTIFVDVAGAVERPGVYSFSLESRYQDALIAAGGLSENADREYVSKRLNLAQKLVDGGKIYIPTVEDNITGYEFNTEALGMVSDSSSSKIKINTASVSELESLPGIGEVTASKIVNGRPYTSLDELLEKKVVGNKVFESIKELISL